ncbi:hypothetical protein NDU88_002895 [Pleurodeles waltl]|uniref:Uncharacterized protein n=1 Tax=Pleurodeles waltl TaxID=8319 RepID=A0AAV7UC88_PLEWA|nr:hypothetical protein NDU88_002895 [Pleurodeles waltl]
MGYPSGGLPGARGKVTVKRGDQASATAKSDLYPRGARPRGARARVHSNRTGRTGEGAALAEDPRGQLLASELSPPSSPLRARGPPAGARPGWGAAPAEHLPRRGRSQRQQRGGPGVPPPRPARSRGRIRAIRPGGARRPHNSRSGQQDPTAAGSDRTVTPASPATHPRSGPRARRFFTNAPAWGRPTREALVSCDHGREQDYRSLVGRKRSS